MIVHGEICSDPQHRFLQPLVYGLLPNKEKSTYVRFLLALQQICGGRLEPKKWVVDLEKGKEILDKE